MVKNDLLLRTAKGLHTQRPPVWVMRQAGRILPQYRKLRGSFQNFKEFLYNSEATAEASLQPVEALGVDAVIVFSDILVIPEALGCNYEMVESKGPVFLNKIETVADVLNLNSLEQAIESLSYVFKTVGIIEEKVNGSLPIIGFAGGPWTIFAYMVEGKGSKDFSTAKKWLYQNPEFSHQLLEKITDLTIQYLKIKIQLGCEVVQLFDSWAGILSPVHFQEFSLKYLNKICKSITEVPVILFAKGAMLNLDSIDKSECDVIGLDWNIPISKARQNLGNSRVIQGNLDPCLLYADDEIIVRETIKLIQEANGHHIVNLGHGVYPDTDPRKVKLMIDTVKDYSY